MVKHVEYPAKIAVRTHNKFYNYIEIYPQVVRGGYGLEITGWSIKDEEEIMRGLYDVLLFTVLKRTMLHKICALTFENDKCKSIPVEFAIADEVYEFHMRAIEKEHEMVHYEIEINNEWMDLIDTYVGDVIDEEIFSYAENEVQKSIGFGADEEVYEKMA